VIGAISLLAGVLLGVGATASPGGHWVAVASILAASGCCTPWRRQRFTRIGVSVLAGMALATLHTHRWESLRLPVEPAASRGLFEGRIASVPEHDGVSVRFIAEGGFVAGIRHDERARRVRLEWPENAPVLRVGERWRLLVRLETIEPTRNFAGLDTARLAFREGIHAIGRVMPSSLDACLEQAAPSLHGVRARLAAAISAAIVDSDAAALITALAVGLTGDVSADQWRVFNATGTTHLVAISGLHVTLFAWLAFHLARGAWRWLPLRGLEREPFAWCVGLAAAGGYACLAGLSVPTQRTWLMLSVYVFARCANRHVGAGRLWALALVFVLLADPLSTLSAGFWLSFVAVGVLMICGQPVGPRENARRWIWSALKLQTAVMLALAPAGLAVFGAVSVVGLVVNLFAIPLVSFLFIPVIVAGVLGYWLAPELGEALFAASAALYHASWPALVWFADLPGATWRVHPAGVWFLLALPAMVAGLFRWPAPLRLTVVAAGLPLMFGRVDVPPEGEARIEVFDAGRGTAVWVRTHSHDLLFDTGDTWGTRGNRMRHVVIPMLDSAAANVDLLVLPTLDTDRATAAAWLAFERGIGRIVAGGGWPGSRLATERCGSSRWTWDGVRFDTLTAGSGGRHCLLRLVVPGGSVLLTGDIDAAAERSLLARHGSAALASDVVMVSRQASATGSSPEWIEGLSPGLAIASGGPAGARSREVVLDRWRRANARVIDTRREGAVRLSVGVRGVEIDATASESRYPFVWRRSLRYSPPHVGNSASRRPFHVADHPVFHRAGRDRARKALDPAAQARIAPGAHQESDSARGGQPGQREGDRSAGEEFAAGPGAGRRAGEPASRAGHHDGAGRGRRAPRRA
jgi:competence protein ComEC